MKCTICLEKIKNSTTIPCNHTFCFECVIKWLDEKDSCPICRKKTPFIKNPSLPRISYFIHEINRRYTFRQLFTITLGISILLISLIWCNLSDLYNYKIDLYERIKNNQTGIWLIDKEFNYIMIEKDSLNYKIVNFTINIVIAVVTYLYWRN